MQQLSARSVQTGALPPVVAGVPVVNVWYRGRSMGLYRVMQLGERDMVLKHGTIAFPVGSLLDVVDFQRLLPAGASSRLSAWVVDNGRGGIHLAW